MTNVSEKLIDFSAVFHAPIFAASLGMFIEEGFKKGAAKKGFCYPSVLVKKTFHLICFSRNQCVDVLLDALTGVISNDIYQDGSGDRQHDGNTTAYDQHKLFL